jgi:hypothetical protein
MKKVSIWRRSMAARLAISQLLVVAVPLVLFLSIFFVWGVGEGITSSTERLQGYVQSRAQYLERSDHWFNKNAVFLINAAKVGDLKTAAEKQKLTPYLTKLATTYGLFRGRPLACWCSHRCGTAQSNTSQLAASLDCQALGHRSAWPSHFL